MFLISQEIFPTNFQTLVHLDENYQMDGEDTYANIRIKFQEHCHGCDIVCFNINQFALKIRFECSRQFETLF